MGSCFSKRKRGSGVAAVTHNASPRSSFSFSCKGDAASEPSVLHPHKPVNEIVVVVTKDAAPFLGKKSHGSSTDAQSVQPRRMLKLEQDSSQSQSLSPPAEADSVPRTCEDAKALQGCHGLEDSTIKKPPVNLKQAEHALSLAHGHSAQSVAGGHACCDDVHDRNMQVEKAPPSLSDEFVIEAVEMKPCLGKLKRSRSCEDSMQSDTSQPPRCRFLQETTVSSRLEAISEPHFGTTKYLEGLDLVDVLPSSTSQSEIPSFINGGHHYESSCLSIDFFNLKSRYLSSCSTVTQQEKYDGLPLMALSCNEGHSAEDGMTKSFAVMHSRASSLDSLEQVATLFSSSRRPIPAVAEEDEAECYSDDSETFEFKQAMSAPHAPNGWTSQLENRVKGEVNEDDEEGDFKELSVVATGDAVLYTSSKSEDFDLIPSKSHVWSSPKLGIQSSAMVSSYPDSLHSSQRRLEDEEDKHPSVDDIICLLESDELDEDVLLSFLNLARSTATGYSGNTTSCHVSDVASEVSFEFKVKSSGSTPQSTPSTPMLSAGSTPKRVTQLSPLALTAEEIAEIWGVFEQRQALSSPRM